MGDTAKVTIKDLDNLRYPFDKRTGYTIHIYSDSDQAGVNVDAYWKPNYRGTPQMHGDYPVKITFIDTDRRESTSNSITAAGGGSRVELKVVPGDNIYAEYFDRTLPAIAPDGKRYSTEDKLKISTIAKVVSFSTPVFSAILLTSSAFVILFLFYINFLINFERANILKKIF